VLIEPLADQIEAVRRRLKDLRERPAKTSRDVAPELEELEHVLAQAHAELQQSGARTQAILDCAVDGVITIDELGNIISANPSAEVMFGYSVEELRGHNVKMLMDTPYRQEHDEYLRRYRDTGRRRIIGIGREVVGRRKGGATFPMDLAVSEFFHGEGRSFVGTIRDLTEHRRLEDQFRQAQKMEAVGRLAGGVAHDFNTLLGTITGYSEMLLDGLPPDDPLRRAAEQIRRGAERGAGLTRQLLAFSRRQVLQPEVLSLKDILDDIDDMLGRLLGDDVELQRVEDPGLGQVRVDAGQIGQVMMNLVVNAADAMHRGGRIVIETCNVELDELASAKIGAPAAGSYVLLAVRDTGCGIDAETRKHLFEPFFTTKELGKGTGLGLSTVFGIVKQSGGGIAVESEVGQGTTFKIYLPRWEAAPEDDVAAPMVTAPVASTAGAETVLLVEDDEMFRDLLAEVLAAQGYSVLTAAEPAEALVARDQHEGVIDLLVSDMVMPGGMTGSDLARQLTERAPEMKVILMSGYTDEDLAERDVGGHTELFLQKPFSTKSFLGSVREVLERDL
jgi:two-component system cell cycle sensor histidine kinase/response regulator CckA